MWSGLLHAGLSGTILGLPHVAPLREDIRASGAGAAFYGLPFDATNISRTGANYGPRSIRELSVQFQPYSANLNFDLLEAIRPVDCGDCSVVLANAEKTFDRAQADIGEILAGGAVPVVIGGDHSITIPPARAVAAAKPKAGLVLIDAHLDTAADVGGETLNHCCPIPRAIDAGFDPSKVVLIGMSGWMNPKSELAYCLEHGIRVIWIEEIWERGAAWAAQQAVEVAGGDDGIYLSFDVDSLDAAYAPGTCCPTPGGLTSREAIELVRGVAAAGLVGMDVAETAPSLESAASATTSLIAMRVMLEALAHHAGASFADRGEAVAHA